MNEIVEEIIETIENELCESSYTEYYCSDGTIINCDVGYINQWFDEYSEVLRRKYSTGRE